MSKSRSNHPEIIEIVPYDPIWEKIYKFEENTIKEVLSTNCLAIHHFGSTSIPGLAAKPKIDILVEVKSFNDIDIQALEKLGFEYRGEVIPTGRYLAKQSPRVHVHIFEAGNPLIKRNLIFRDWLKAHPGDRNAYEQLKYALAAKHTDGMDYCRAKTEFISKIIDKALTLIK